MHRSTFLLLSTLLCSLSLLVSCKKSAPETDDAGATPAAAETEAPSETEAPAPAEADPKTEVAEVASADVVGEDGKAHAYFASGCFWCVEAVFESVRGVDESISGYSGGHTENPTYESSNTGRTGHAEAVEIIYDPKVVSFATLVDVYFGSQEVTQVNGQGPDRGSQYRSILFYENEAQKKIIDEKVAALNAELAKDDEKVAAEIMPFEKFWVGEDYHQDYEKLNPENPYIQNVSIPRLKRFQAKFPHLLKEGQGH